MQSIVCSVTSGSVVLPQACINTKVECSCMSQFFEHFLYKKPLASSHANYCSGTWVLCEECPCCMFITVNCTYKHSLGTLLLVQENVFAI